MTSLLNSSEEKKLPPPQVSSWTKTSDQLVFVANKTLVPMNPTEMILFDYGLTVDYVTGKG